MALALTTITNSIAALSVSGVTIKDIDEIPESVLPRDCPIMYPEPNEFIRDFTYIRQTQGGGAVAKADVTYNMVYAFLFAPVGSTRGLLDSYSGMVTKVGLIYDKMITSNELTGLVELNVQDTLSFGAIQDPSGNWFIGTNLTFSILEFVN